MTVSDFLTALAPVLAGAASWDPVGLQLGDPAASVGRVAVCHEVNDRTLAGLEGIDTLVAYHPLLFTPTTSLVAGSSPEGRAHALISRGVALVVVHTGWDVATGGTADALAAALGVDVEGGFGAEDEEGPFLGRIGAWTGTIGELVAATESRLGAVAVRVAGDDGRIVAKVAVLPGSGSSFIAEAASAGADVLVTGDVSHHRATAALDAGLAVVDVGHTPSERPGMAALLAHVSRLVGDPVDLTKITTSPWEGR